jgi:hypothetical protein
VSAPGRALFVLPTSERDRELRGRAGRLYTRRFRLELEVRQDLGLGMALRDHRDHTPQCMAHSAAQNLHIEAAAHELRPQSTVQWAPRTAEPLLSSLSIIVACSLPHRRGE